MSDIKRILTGDRPILLRIKLREDLASVYNQTAMELHND